MFNNLMIVVVINPLIIVAKTAITVKNVIVERNSIDGEVTSN